MTNDEIALKIIEYATFESTAPVSIGIATTEIVEALDAKDRRIKQVEEDLDSLIATSIGPSPSEAYRELIAKDTEITRLRTAIEKIAMFLPVDDQGLLRPDFVWPNFDPVKIAKEALTK